MQINMQSILLDESSPQRFPDLRDTPTLSAEDLTFENELDVGLRRAVSATDCPCMAGFQEHVADVVALFAAHPPMTFPFTMNFTFPAVLTDAVMLIAVPLATVTTPPASEIEIVAAPAVTVRVDVTETFELKLVVSVGVRVAVRVVLPCPTTVIVLPDTEATPVLELV